MLDIAWPMLVTESPVPQGFLIKATDFCRVFCNRARGAKEKAPGGEAES